MTDEILELSSLAPTREKVRLRTEADPDGTIYELAEAGDFGAVGLSRLGQKVAEVDRLWMKPKLSPAEEKRLVRLLDEVTGTLVIDAPMAAVAALPAISKRALAARFFVLTGVGAQPLLAEALRTSESSSPGSNGFTEETPGPGPT